MTIVPCDRNKRLSQQIIDFAEILKTEAHKLGAHGLDENDVYNSGLFRGAIERIRGQFAATMSEKREFVRRILSYMQDHEYIASFESSGERNRHDYTVALPSGKLAAERLPGQQQHEHFRAASSCARILNLECLLQSGGRPSTQCLVGHPHSIERRDHC